VTASSRGVRTQGNVQKAEGGAERDSPRDDPGVLRSPELALAAKVLERMVNQNTFEEIALDFRYWEDASDQFKAAEGTLLPLWKFYNERAKKKAVTAIAWSPVVRHVCV